MVRFDLSEELRTLLRADVEALTIWLDGQKDTVVVVGRDPEIHQEIVNLMQKVEEKQLTDPQLLRQLPEQQKLRQLLKVTCEEMNYDGFVVINSKFQMIAADLSDEVGMILPERHRALVSGVLASGKPQVTRPFKSVAMLRDENQREVVGRPTMYSVTRVADGVMLGLRIRPEDDFTRILQIARFGKSGETYAFDADGLMISRSRFNEQLKEIGLIDDVEGTDSILNVAIRDPGVNLTTGARSADRRGSLPLTLMARDAIHAGKSQDYETYSNVKGYNDYRGVPVIGAWKWLPEYEFGVTTEVDVDEAYAPLILLRTIFGGLFLLVVIGTTVSLFFSRSIERITRRMLRAEKKMERMGQYTLEEKIGEGGMGEVYRASHAMLRRPTAVKILRAESSSDEAVQRFEREVQLTCLLTHPNTIAIYDYGRTPENVFYYAMEFLVGANLSELVQIAGPLPPGRVIHLLQQICGSLHEAHLEGLIHRDVKPANIFLTRRGAVGDFVKVLDFGLVKYTGGEGGSDISSPGVITGTPLYISPEGIETPLDVDARADIYSVGAVGYYLLTGDHVFSGRSAVEICHKHLLEEPQSPSQRAGSDVPADLEGLILQCLKKKAADRPQTALELAQKLAECGSSGSWSEADASLWWEEFQPTENEEKEADLSSKVDIHDETLVVDFGSRNE